MENQETSTATAETPSTEAAPGGFATPVHDKGDLGAGETLEPPTVIRKDIRGPRG
jgi:hypothetical protein